MFNKKSLKNDRKFDEICMLFAKQCSNKSQKTQDKMGKSQSIPEPLEPRRERNHALNISNTNSINPLRSKINIITNSNHSLCKSVIILFQSMIDLPRPAIEPFSNYFETPYLPCSKTFSYTLNFLNWESSSVQAVTKQIKTRN